MDTQSLISSVESMGISEDDRINQLSPDDQECDSREICDGRVVCDSREIEAQQENIGAQNRDSGYLDDSLNNNRDSGRFIFSQRSSCDNRNYIASQTSNRESETLSQSIPSQDKTSEAKFRAIPELANFWKKIKFTSGKVECNCLRCPTVISTREINRLGGHMVVCKNMNSEEKARMAALVDEYNASLNFQKIDLMWTNVMINCNFSFASVEDGSFKAFFQEFMPAWKIPSRKKISNKLVPYLSNRIEKKFAKQICDSGSSHVTIEFDHWKDASKKLLLGVIASYGDDGFKHLLDMIDVSREGHASAVTVDRIVSCIKSKIKPRSINSIISDSASACRSAREQLVLMDDFKHALQHRCLAHLVNSMGTLITSVGHAVDTSKAASKLAAIIGSNPRVAAAIDDAECRRVVTACSVRWYTTVKMMESLIDAKDVIVEELPQLEDPQDTMFWCNVEALLVVLRPLADTIAFVERRGTSLGEAVKRILQVGKSIFESDWADNFNLSSVTAYLNYVCPRKLKNDEFALLLTAYALDARFKQDFLTEDGIDLVLKLLGELALKWGHSINFVKYQLRPEFDNFILRKGDFSAENNESALSWWLERKELSALRVLALRIARLKASSANIERTFSTLKYIQGPQRPRFYTAKLVEVGRVKLSNTNRVDDSVTVDCDSEGFVLDGLEEKVELLDQKARQDYEEFVKYIDYSIINERTGSSSSPEGQAEPNAIAEILLASRKSRAQRRTGV